VTNFTAFTPGGAGGTASGGDINSQGGYGNVGIIGSATNNQVWGGGGGVAALYSASVTGTSGVSTAAGATGIGFGSGGSGGQAEPNGGAVTGGKGANGVIIVTTYFQ
jgi:hypothetical protein